METWRNASTSQAIAGWGLRQRRGAHNPQVRGTMVAMNGNALNECRGKDALLEPCVGIDIVHELLPGQSARAHVVSGEVRLFDVILSQGDDAGVTAERSIPVTAQESEEAPLRTHRHEPGGDSGDRSVLRAGSTSEIGTSITWWLDEC